MEIPILPRRESSRYAYGTPCVHSLPMLNLLPRSREMMWAGNRFHVIVACFAFHTCTSQRVSRPESRYTSQGAFSIGLALWHDNVLFFPYREGPVFKVLISFGKTMSVSLQPFFFWEEYGNWLCPLPIPWKSLLSWWHKGLVEIPILQTLVSLTCV